MKIAVLMVCFNRRDKTLAALKSLYFQSASVEFDVYLVDDGSTDGTAAEVTKAFPNVRLLFGDGSFYWAGGMRRARAAVEESGETYSQVLWLNDDVTLDPDALEQLLSVQAAAWAPERTIVTGAVLDPETRKVSFSGVRRRAIHPLNFRRLVPTGKVERCDAMSGNVVLIPSSVHTLVGPYEPRFSHTLIDLDFGLRARQQGVEILLAPRAVGCCSQNAVSGWVDPRLSWSEKLRSLRSPKGPPPREWLFFARRHGGTFWFLFGLTPYRHLLNGIPMQVRSQFRWNRRPRKPAA